MNRDHVNFLMISEKEGIKQYMISQKELVYKSLILAFVIIAVILSVTYIDSTLELKQGEYYLLKNGLEDEMMRMREEVESMRKYMKKVNLMVEDDLVADGTNGFQVYGVGGGEELSDVDDKNLEKEITGELHDLKNSLYDDIESLDNDLNILVLSLENVKNKLDATPSIFPVKGIITSGFGYRKSPFTGRREYHRGIDILNELGTPIISPADGVVKEISVNPLWGLNMLISHGHNVETQYGHLQKTLIKVGQKVKRGQAICELGKTGRTTGPHLHYQIWVKGTPVDPMDYIIEEDVSIAF